MAKVAKQVEKSSADEISAMMAACREQLSKPALKHLEMLVDTKRAAPVRPVYSMGGSESQSMLVSTKAEVDLAVGTGGVGFALVNPVTAGPTSDRTCCLYSTSASTLTASGALPIVGAGAGVVATLQWQTGALWAANAAWSRYQGSFRCVACSLYISPTSSATNQNGVVYLFESQTHQSSGATVQQIESALQTRAIRAVQTGDPSVENVVNWHPKVAIQYFASQPAVDGGYIDDFRFRVAQALATDANMGDTHIGAIVTGASGSTYHVEIYAVYELVGTSTNNLRPRYYDDVGWSHIQNAINRKMMAGWIGTGSGAQKAYKQAVVQTAASADNLEDGAERELRAATKKPGKDSDSGFLGVVKDLAPALGELAKDAVGFIL